MRIKDVLFNLTDSVSVPESVGKSRWRRTESVIAQVIPKKRSKPVFCCGCSRR